MCAFKLKRGRDMQRTCIAIWPYASLIASEATSSSLFLFELLPSWGQRLPCHAQGYSEMSPHKRKEKKEKMKKPTEIQIMTLFESCKEMMILYLKLSDASSKILHCYVMYYHSNLSLHWYRTPYGQAVLCQRCRCSDDARNTEQLNSKSLK